MNTSAAIDLTEFKRGWQIVLLAFVGVATSASVAPLYGFGTLVVPLQDAFGWSRSELLATTTFSSFGAVFSSQLAGWLNRKYGMKPVAIASFFGLALAYVVMSQMDLFGGSIWVLYSCFFLVTFAGIGTLQVTWTQLVNLWFEKNRGLALAMILSGSGFAGVVLPPMITSVVELWGWRSGFLLLGILPIFLTLPLALIWLRPMPGSLDEAGSGDESVLNRIPGIPFSEAVVSWRYWVINLSMVMAAGAIIIMVVNTVPLLQDKGFSPITSSQMFSTFGVSLVAGRVVVGYLVDRLWAPGVAFVTLSLPAVGCFLLGSVDDVSLLIVGIALVGIGAGAEFDLAAFFIARYFGMRDYARLFGLQMGVISGGICLAPALTAYLYQTTGSYAVILDMNIILFAISAAILLTLGRYPTLHSR